MSSVFSAPEGGIQLIWTAVINYAVPMEQLDSVVNDIVERLLQRSAYGLAWTKRVINRLMQDQLNRTLDAAAAYEMVSFLQLERTGFKDKTTLG